MRKAIIVAMLVGMCWGGGGQSVVLPQTAQTTVRGCFFDCIAYKKVVGIAFCTRWQWTCLGAR
jgi:hypothetical protein